MEHDVKHKKIKSLLKAIESQISTIVWFVALAVVISSCMFSVG